MAGSALAIGVLAVTTALASGLASVGAAAAWSQRLAGAADAAALAAADAASGAVSGDPCVRADELAGASGARVSTCAIDGLIATVTVSASFGPISAAASARAGPPRDQAVAPTPP